ncbi:MAG: hypothetical protein KIH63_002235 [Candidatus Saccharibacteria bacterium]|nr:hypothetical protein [Candidatus Saccharibacteria bacterium]
MNSVDSLLPKGMPESVPLHYVPSETVYVADGFAIAPLPLGTTAMKVFNPYVPATEWIHAARADDLVALQRNSRHRRSYGLAWDDMPEDVDVTIKGADWSNPSLRPGYRIRDTEYFGGLQYEDAEAALQAGTRLDEAGIYGERIVRIDAPQALPMGNELHEPQYVIDEIVESYIFMKGKYRTVLSRDTHRPVVAIRTAPTDIRLWDFQADASASQLSGYLEVGMQRAAEVDDAYAGMNPLEPADAEALFMKVLPDLYGRQMGRLEGSGLRQRYPHVGNIAIDGGLIDLDGIMPNRKSRIFRYADHFVEGAKRAQEVLAGQDMAPYPSRFYDLKVRAEFVGSFKKGKRQ